MPLTVLCLLWRAWKVLGSWGRHTGSVDQSSLYSSCISRWHVKKQNRLFETAPNRGINHSIGTKSSTPCQQNRNSPAGLTLLPNVEGHRAAPTAAAAPPAPARRLIPWWVPGLCHPHRLGWDQQLDCTAAVQILLIKFYSCGVALRYKMKWGTVLYSW